MASLSGAFRLQSASTFSLRCSTPPASPASRFSHHAGVTFTLALTSLFVWPHTTYGLQRTAQPTTVIANAQASAASTEAIAVDAMAPEAVSVTAAASTSAPAMQTPKQVVPLQQRDFRGQATSPEFLLLLAYFSINALQCQFTVSTVGLQFELKRAPTPRRPLLLLHPELWKGWTRPAVAPQWITSLSLLPVPDALLPRDTGHRGAFDRLGFAPPFRHQHPQPPRPSHAAPAFSRRAVLHVLCVRGGTCRPMVLLLRFYWRNLWLQALRQDGRRRSPCAVSYLPSRLSAPCSHSGPRPRLHHGQCALLGPHDRAVRHDLCASSPYKTRIEHWRWTTLFRVLLGPRMSDVITCWTYSCILISSFVSHSMVHASSCTRTVAVRMHDPVWGHYDDTIKNTS